MYEIPDPGEGEEAKKPEMQLAEEQPDLGSSALQSLEAWSNMWAHILDDGRTTYVKPEDMEEEAWEAKMGEIAEEDKVDRFRSLELHTKVPGVEAAWTSKIVGDTQPYTKGEGTVTFAYNVVRSLRWPGAVAVAKGGKFVNVYIGWGIKRGDTAQQPNVPGSVMDDPGEPTEMPEPNPKEEPVEAVEEDTNAQGEDLEDD